MTKLADALDTFAEAAAALAHEYRAADGLPEMAATTPQAVPRAAPITVPFDDTPQARSAQGGCPVHGLPWVIRPAGTSKKTGEPYNAFWHCNEQNGDGSYCREKPSPAWVKAHPAT